MWTLILEKFIFVFPKRRKTRIVWTCWKTVSFVHLPPYMHGGALFNESKGLWWTTPFAKESRVYGWHIDFIHSSLCSTLWKCCEKILQKVLILLQLMRQKLASIFFSTAYNWRSFFEMFMTCRRQICKTATADMTVCVVWVLDICLP